jgi:hypothetical protein
MSPSSDAPAFAGVALEVEPTEDPRRPVLLVHNERAVPVAFGVEVLLEREQQGEWALAYRLVAAPPGEPDGGGFAEVGEEFIVSGVSRLLAGGDTFRARLRLPELSSGRYRLALKVRDEAAGTSGRVSTGLAAP